MSDLSSNLEELVLAGRMASRPTDADVTRVLQAIESRLATVGGASLLEAEVAATRGGNLRLFPAKIIGIAVAGLAIVAGVVSHLGDRLSVHSELPLDANGVVAVAGEAAVPVSPAIESVNASATAPLEDATLPSSQSRDAQAVASAREMTRTHDSLSEEVAVLSRAEQELHAGRAEAALRLISEHERRLPRGILAEERTAARIQAFCALGRVAEANAQLARLSPASLHGDHAKQACNSRKQDTSSRAADVQSVRAPAKNR
jgi:hypothetical protein